MSFKIEKDCSMKLTNEQINELHEVWCAGPSRVWDSIQLLIAAYHSMLAASPNMRVVETIHGFEFVYPSGSLHMEDHLANYTFAVRRTPKPCPPPKLDPVAAVVSVEDVYVNIPLIPEGYEAVFGYVIELREKGFHTFISDDGKNILDSVNFLQSPSLRRICLRKWEGK